MQLHCIIFFINYLSHMYNTILLQCAIDFVGLALIYLKLVDSTGHPKTLLECPKPDPSGWKTFNSENFKRFVLLDVVVRPEPLEYL